MRTALILAALLAITTPANAQRVFRASSIDIEQNERLGKIESQVDRIEASIASLAVTIENRAVKDSLTPVRPKPVAATQVVTKPVVNRQPASHYTQTELIGIVQAAYPGGDYTRHADVSPRSAVWSHLQDSNHQFTAAQVNGLPQGIALGLHGLHHAGRIKATRSSQTASPQVARSQPAIQQFIAQPSVQSVGGCANGQCARPSQPAVRFRSFGIFRR
jgi:hypothetical protein